MNNVFETGCINNDIEKDIIYQSFISASVYNFLTFVSTVHRISSTMNTNFFSRLSSYYLGACGMVLPMVTVG